MDRLRPAEVVCRKADRIAHRLLQSAVCHLRSCSMTQVFWCCCSFRADCSNVCSHRHSNSPNALTPDDWKSTHVLQDAHNHKYGRWKESRRMVQVKPILEHPNGAYLYYCSYRSLSRNCEIK